ncbi:GNAT family N-acetyltransferase [Novosphingobium lentum]|uniref:GNAT family N-acetyltransferase n=1 Tax=Novosphingobium lentum TaxID=145287 RepID=UPI000836485A|nr:GNAT family N-acetyltransferase [Novosphingobium lentum]
MTVQDDIDRIMHVMTDAFDPAFGEAWNRRQIGDALILPATHYGLIFGDGSIGADDADDVAGFFLSRAVLDEEELLLFAIAPPFRHRGLGHRLLDHFIAQARDRGMQRLFLEMRKDNPAGQLYYRHGFRPVGIRPAYYRTPSGIRLDAVSQELVLN